jgi:uncharacterized protein (DUF305 family)
MKPSQTATFLLSLCLGVAFSVSLAALAHEPTADSATSKMAASDSPSMQLHRVMMGPSMKVKMSMSGDVDKDFALMMTMHHQQAIDMADVLIKHGRNAELKTMARKMKSAQQTEFRQMARFTK